MHTAKASLILVALVAGVALVQAAGGIKGQRLEESQQRASGLKGPRPPQQYQQLQQQQQLQQVAPQQQLPVAALPPRPIQAPVKGVQVAPIFRATKVQPPAPVVQQQQLIQQQEQEPEIQQQQQQQESEIDPTGAAQDSAPAILAPAPGAAPAAAEAAEEANPRPEPYAFTYGFESGDSATSGSSQREEQQDASGKVTGFYTLKGEDGRDRRVDYVADANGFRATISTNEMGTADKDSADVDWQAQSPSDAQLRVAESATQAARQRALLNPQPAASASSQQANKVSSPRQNAAAVAAAGQQREPFAASSKTQQQVAEPAIAQLQEPFEQIRQVELNARARKSRHAPFYLFTI